MSQVIKVLAKSGDLILQGATCMGIKGSQGRADSPLITCNQLPVSPVNPLAAGLVHAWQDCQNIIDNETPPFNQSGYTITRQLKDPYLPQFSKTGLPKKSPKWSASSVHRETFHHISVWATKMYRNARCHRERQCSKAYKYLKLFFQHTYVIHKMWNYNEFQVPHKSSNTKYSSVLS